MDVRTRRDIQLVNDTMGYLAELDGQDLMLVVECGQHMLYDIVANDALDALQTYIRRYCNVTDNEAQVLDIEKRILLKYANAGRSDEWI